MAEKMQTLLKENFPKPDMSSIKLISQIKSRGIITEQEIKLLRRRLNDGKIKYEDTEILNGMGITEEQTKKGFNWLNGRWKDLGYREQEVLRNFKEFRLDSFTDQSNYQQRELGFSFWIPVWNVVAKDGSGFQYIMEAGEAKIIG